MFWPYNGRVFKDVWSLDLLVLDLFDFWLFWLVKLFSLLASFDCLDCPKLFRAFLILFPTFFVCFKPIIFSSYFSRFSILRRFFFSFSLACCSSDTSSVVYLFIWLIFSSSKEKVCCCSDESTLANFYLFNSCFKSMIWFSFLIDSSVSWLIWVFSLSIYRSFEVKSDLRFSSYFLVYFDSDSKLLRSIIFYPYWENKRTFCYKFFILAFKL